MSIESPLIPSLAQIVRAVADAKKRNPDNPAKRDGKAQPEKHKKPDDMSQVPKEIWQTTGRIIDTTA